MKRLLPADRLTLACILAIWIAAAVASVTLLCVH